MARVRMSGHERREQLIGIGREVFAEVGFAGATVEEIAARAGVTKPVVYEHFGGKEGLYAVVVDREVERLRDLMEAALESAERPRGRLEAVTAAFLEYIEKEPTGFGTLVRDAPVGSSVGSLSSVMGDVAASVESLLAREFESTGHDGATAPLYAQALVGMVALVGQWWLDAGKPDRRDVAAHLVNLAWNGLKDLETDPRLVADLEDEAEEE